MKLASLRALTLAPSLFLFRSCKRDSNNLKSPLFQTFNDSLSGLVSVRAYGGEEAVKQEAEERCDKYFRAAAIAWDTTRWVNVAIAPSPHRS
jgi:hypothetical protein